MGWFTSSATTVEGCQRIASACAPKASALKQCVAINGERACEGLASDYELCRATRMKACEDIAEALKRGLRAVSVLDARVREESDALSRHKKFASHALTEERRAAALAHVETES